MRESEDNRVSSMYQDGDLSVKTNAQMSRAGKGNRTLVEHQRLKAVKRKIVSRARWQTSMAQTRTSIESRNQDPQRRLTLLDTIKKLSPRTTHQHTRTAKARSITATQDRRKRLNNVDTTESQEEEEAQDEEEIADKRKKKTNRLGRWTPYMHSTASVVDMWEKVERW
ncbi:hypothetical protein BC567DRAFT_210069 [Phyllosticta citribraziliensis]